MAAGRLRGLGVRRGSVSVSDISLTTAESKALDGVREFDHFGLLHFSIAAGGVMDVNTALQEVLKTALIHDGLPHGIHKAAKISAKPSFACLHLTAMSPCMFSWWRSFVLKAKST